jgi:hypothetical protein
VWPDRVVVPLPALDDDLSLLRCVEDFTIQQLIAKLRVEAFTVSILLRASWHDVGRLCSHGCKPIPESLYNTLGDIA